MGKLIRSVLIFIIFLLIWQAIVRLGHLPFYLLPSPLMVAQTLQQNAGLLLANTWPTILETLLGLLIGTLVGGFAALLLAQITSARQWCLPLLLISQALPTFALAPLFVVWFGYGMTSKILTTVIMLFFPIASNCYDGLTRLPDEYAILATTLNATRWGQLRHIQFPAALPAFASGLRIAATIAPIGAIIGEWVGSTEGLGYIMLMANARLNISLLFSALTILIIWTLLLYYSIDYLSKKIIFWN